MSRVAVIGGGIAGLVAAYEASRRGADVVLCEAAPRTGGVILTERTEGCLLEGGPDGFLGGADDIPELCAELGIADRVVGQERRDVLLWEGGKLERLPPGKAAEVLEHATGEAEASRWFLTLQDGLGTLVDSLTERLAGRVRTRSPVGRLARAGSGFALGLPGNELLEVDAVVLAVPSAAAARLAQDLDTRMAALLAAQDNLSTATIVLGYSRADVAHPLDASGFVSPRRENPVVVACTFASSKFPGRAPEGMVLLRAHVGRFGRPELLESNDATIVQAVEQDLARVLGLRGAARFSRVFRWPRALPKPEPGREERLARLHARAADVGLLTCGAAFGGVGLSACVKSGRAAGAAASGALVA
ncbi:MAG: protoporphyrinogen oxidase [Gemmatimonadales bacterium]